MLDVNKKKKTKPKIQNELQKQIQRMMQAQDRRKRRKAKTIKQPQFALENGIERFDTNVTKLYYIGGTSHECQHCNASLWLGERTTDSSNAKPEFNQCCQKGSIQLPPMPEPPKILKEFFEDFKSPEGKCFHKNTRAINCALAMSSMEVDQVIFSNVKHKAPPIFKINGLLTHQIGALTPSKDSPHQFAQIYILDPDKQTDVRINLNGLAEIQGRKNAKKEQIGRKVLVKLQTVLMKHNILIRTIKNAYEISQQQFVPDVEIQLKGDVIPEGAHERTYNEPTANEVAVVIPTQSILAEEVLKRQLVIQYKGGHLKRIFETNGLYDPLQYVLFHPYASWGWGWKIRKKIIHDKDKRMYIQFCFFY